MHSETGFTTVWRLNYRWLMSLQKNNDGEALEPGFWGLEIEVGVFRGAIFEVLESVKVVFWESLKYECPPPPTPTPPQFIPLIPTPVR